MATPPRMSLVRTIFAAFAQYERRVIAARTKAAVLRHQANGIAISKDPPYGKRIGPRRELGGRMRRTLVDDAGEQEVIERVVTMHKSGMGLRAIARVLNEDGVTARGRSWRHALVGKIVERNDKIAKTAATESRVASADGSGRLSIPANLQKSSPE
jgi:site-specific DNA recombinase